MWEAREKIHFTYVACLLTESDAAPVTDLILLRGKGLRFLSILKYLLLRLAGSVAMWRRPVVIFRKNAWATLHHYCSTIIICTDEN
jgi:hypothetical protein